MITVLWAAGSDAKKKKKKKRQSVGSVRPPTNSALSHAATLYTAARSCSPLSLLPWPLTLQSSWRAEPLTAPFCLHVHWSMKHAICQNWDAGILNVNRHHSELSLNYITVAGTACLACLGSFTVDSAVFCIRNKHKLWSYIHTVWAYIKTNTFYLNYGGGFWSWWWKVEINLLSVWLEFLCMSTQSGLWNMLLVSLLCGSYSTVRAWFFSSSPPSLLFTSPPWPGWPLLQQTTTAQLTLKQRVFTSDRLRGQPISALSCADCLMLRSWTKANPLHYFLL